MNKEDNIFMNSAVKDILKEIQQCDSFHNNCDCLLDNNECDYLLEYIEQLEKEVERLKEREKLVTEHYNVMVRHAGNLEGKIIQLETNNDTAINFIDQVLQYHLSPFDYKQVDEDINTLIDILQGGSNE